MSITMMGLAIFVYMLIGIAFVYATYLYMEKEIKSGSYKNVNLSLIAVGLFWPFALIVVLLLKLLKV